MTTTILIADDHVLFRQGLAALLREQAEWEVVGEAGDGEEAVRLAEALGPQIAVLDIEMPRMTGIEAAHRIRQLSPATRIVALSMYAEPLYQRKMFQAGASAYVLKNEAIDDLVDAIRAALRGERFVSPAIGQQGAASPPRSAVLDRHALTGRELDVLRLLAEGHRTKDVARQLGISAKTVETYRTRLMLKLGIDNLQGLVKFAIQAGLISSKF